MNKQKKSDKNRVVSQKKKPQTKRKKRIFYICLSLLVLGVAGLIYWNTVLPKSNTQVYYGGYEIKGETYIVKGQVTKKSVSCGEEKLLDDGTVKKAGGVCDGGSSLVVDGSFRISTGGGSMVAKRPKYVTDIETISAGDTIEVRYAKDKRGSASTNCGTCYIKKLHDYGVEATFDDSTKQSPKSFKLVD